MGNRKLERVISKTRPQSERQDQLIPGVLGIYYNSQYLTQVPNRSGYVYVRVRNNLSEVVEAFNGTVSPAYGLPVLIARDTVDKSRYIVVGRDLGAYTSGWGTANPYLPQHGDTHSFNPDDPGGDIVWVYPQQFTPYLVYPGTTGTVRVHAYIYNYGGTWYYAGGTGTATLISYKPTGTSTARMVLVYGDYNGNPKLSGGSEFAATQTGTSQIYGNIPNPPGDCLFPLAGVRLTTGTSTIGWSNLYDIRPFFDYPSTGTASSAPIQAAYVTVGNTSLLSGERAITAGAGISLTDGGAGSTITIAVTGSLGGGGGSTPTYPAIYDDGTFKGTGTALHFNDNLTVASSGTSHWINGSAGGASTPTYPSIYDDNTFKATGTALHFNDNLTVINSGTAVWINGQAGGASTPTYPAIYEDGAFKTTGTSINFTDNLNVVVSGSVAHVSSVSNPWVSSAYIGAYFDDSQPSPDNPLFVFRSIDGLTWTDIGASYSGQIRDPEILYYRGTWWIAGTHSGDAGKVDCIELISSTDLVTWSDVTEIDTSALGNSGTTAWAPCWLVDDDDSVHMFIAIGNIGSMQIYETHPTNAGWTTWSIMVQVTGTGFPTDMIDPYMMKIGSTYYLWYKDDGADYLCYATSNQLTSGYTEIRDGDWMGFGTGYEGFYINQIRPDLWRCYMNHVLTDGIHYSESTDNWATWTAPAEISTLASVSHGSVLQITDLTAYPSYLKLVTRLDEWAATTDNTNLNASTAKHGLLPKLGGGVTNYLRADGTWASPYATGSVSGGRELIAERTPTGTTASFTSIPAAYTTLEIEFVARCDKAGTNYNDCSVFFNNDTTAGNYRSTLIFGYGTNTAGVQGADNAYLLNISAATAAAGSCAAGIIRVPYYAGTTFNKQATSHFGQRRDVSSVHEIIFDGALEWESTAAINRVDITLASDSFIAGSTFRLYGVY